MHMPRHSPYTSATGMLHMAESNTAAANSHTQRCVSRRMLNSTPAGGRHACTIAAAAQALRALLCKCSCRAAAASATTATLRSLLQPQLEMLQHTTRPAKQQQQQRQQEVSGRHATCIAVAQGWQEHCTAIAATTALLPCPCRAMLCRRYTPC
jgi:hypothetical protein